MLIIVRSNPSQVALFYASQDAAAMMAATDGALFAKVDAQFATNQF